MGKPAARIGDMHMCPMVTPGLPPIPHVGGPITGPGCPTVLIGGQPAAVMGDMCVCTGPPDSIILGSAGVFIGGKPAARMGDQCAHGGSIVLGCMTVLIGEVSPGPVPMLVAGLSPALEPSPVAGAAGEDAAAAAEASASTQAPVPGLSAVTLTVPNITAPMATKLSRINALLKGAEDGAAHVHKHDDADCKVQYHLLSKTNEPVKGQQYEIRTSDGKTISGKTNSNGLTQSLSGYTESMCTISFLD